MKIGKRAVDTATPRGVRYIIWDDEVKGFGLLVLPTGVKSYLFNYRTTEGMGRRITIGRHGPWTPAQAREKAEDYRDAVRRGADPLGSKRALKEAPTVGEILDGYLSSESFKEKAPSTQLGDRGRIERHLRPLVGKRHVHLLTAEDVKRALAAIRDGKTAADIKLGKHARSIVRGGPGTAREAGILLRSILNWANVTPNPCTGIKLGSSGTRDAIVESHEDYSRLHATLDRMEREGRLRSAAADAIRFIAVTGCRRGEATGLRWRHVDLKQGRVVLPPSAHKTGRKTGKRQPSCNRLRSSLRLGHQHRQRPGR